MNKKFSQIITVTENQTAEKLGSGLLPVFSTPSLVALMENTAMQLIELPEGGSSVGISICVKHLKASVVGTQITCEAELIEKEGRKFSFKLRAYDNLGDLIGEGTHERFVIDIQRFMEKLK